MKRSNLYLKNIDLLKCSLEIEMSSKEKRVYVKTKDEKHMQFGMEGVK